MQPVSTGALRYDSTTIFLHWATVVLVVFQWLGAHTIDFFPRGPLRVDARSLHISVGVLLAAVLLIRLYWRATRGRRLPPAATGPLELLSRAVHFGLYGLIAAMVLVGVFLTWARGDSIFNLFSVPAYEPGNRALADQILKLHETIGWLIVALAGLHAAAALVHRYVWRDGVFGRMLTRG
jgi:cytochrome b561